jgi:beta-lactamase regulating signal transducer with metallopeptidase domain
MIQITTIAGIMLMVWFVASTLAVTYFILQWQREREKRKSAEEMSERHLKALQRYWKAEERVDNCVAKERVDVCADRPCPICGTPMVISVELAVGRRIAASRS